MDRELEHFSAEELIRELEERGYNCYDQEEGVDWDEVDDDTLIDAVEDRGFYVYDEPVDPDEVWFETDVDYKRENLVLPKDFDKNQLVDFLLEALGLGHYITNGQLLEKLNIFINR